MNKTNDEKTQVIDLWKKKITELCELNNSINDTPLILVAKYTSTRVSTKLEILIDTEPLLDWYLIKNHVKIIKHRTSGFDFEEFIEQEMEKVNTPMIERSDLSELLQKSAVKYDESEVGFRVLIQTILFLLNKKKDDENSNLTTIPPPDLNLKEIFKDF